MTAEVIVTILAFLAGALGLGWFQAARRTRRAEAQRDAAEGARLDADLAAVADRRQDESEEIDNAHDLVDADPGAALDDALRDIGIPNNEFLEIHKIR